MNSQRKRRKRPLRKRKGTQKIRIIFFIAGVLLIMGALLTACWQGYKYYENHYGTTQVREAQLTANEGVTSSLVDTSKKETIKLKQEGLDKPIYILFVGVTNATDKPLWAVYLVSSNIQQKTIDVIGIPTAVKVDSRDKKSVLSLNDVYMTGQLKLIKAVIEDMFHIVIPYYVLFDENSFVYASNSFGSMPFFVETPINSTDKDGNPLFLAPGYQELDSNKSWAYFSYREEQNTGVAQLQRQERYIKALVEREQSRLAVNRAFTLYRVWDKVDSNISSWDAAQFAFSTRSLSPDDFHYYILPGSKEMRDKKIYWSVDPVEAQRLVGITMHGQSDNNDANEKKNTNTDNTTTDGKKSINLDVN